MKAVVLAAGKGLRMRPLTNEIPKPLLKIAGKPILQHNLEQLKGIVNEVILIVGYRAEQIKNYFGNEFQGIKIRYVYQKEQMGTGHALLLAKNFVKGKFIVMYGDDLYHREDIERCLTHDLAVLAQEVENPERFGVFIVEDGIIKDVVEKSKNPSSNLANAGFYVLNDKIFDILEKLKLSEREEYELTDAIKKFAVNNRISCELVKKFWISISSPGEMKKAEKMLMVKL